MAPTSKCMTTPTTPLILRSTHIPVYQSHIVASYTFHHAIHSNHVSHTPITHHQIEHVKSYRVHLRTALRYVDMPANEGGICLTLPVFRWSEQLCCNCQQHQAQWRHPFYTLSDSPSPALHAGIPHSLQPLSYLSHHVAEGATTMSNYGTTTMEPYQAVWKIF